MSSKKRPLSEVARVVALNLRTIRFELSQARFSKVIGVEHQATYHRYENGRLPKPAILRMMVKRLGITASELLKPLPAERASELQERALKLCFGASQTNGEPGSVSSHDDFQTPDFCKVLWSVHDEDLEDAMDFFLNKSVRQIVIRCILIKRP